MFKFSTQYRFDDQRMIYALYSEGFRLGGNNSARAAENGILPLEYKPDTLKNYEAGLKTPLAGRDPAGQRHRVLHAVG